MMKGLQLLFAQDGPRLNPYETSNQTKGNPFPDFLSRVGEMGNTVSLGESDQLEINDLIKALMIELELDENEGKSLLKVIEEFMDEISTEELLNEEILEELSLLIFAHLTVESQKDSDDMGISKKIIESLLESWLRDHVSNTKQELEPSLEQMFPYDYHGLILNHGLKPLESSHLELEHNVGQLRDLLEGLGDKADLIQRSSEILSLLNKIYHRSSDGLVELLKEGEGEKLNDLVRELLSRYIKRMDLSQQSPYNTEGKVTRADIVKWIEHLSSTLNAQMIKPADMPIVNEVKQIQSITPIEQYLIYMQRSENQTVMADQLMNQLHSIIKGNNQFQSPFLSQALTIRLKPDHLGEMTVRFTEINGEMTVKILVTSSATKAALETNIHQLKHLFSPHQILIEKIDEGDLLTEDEVLDQGEQFEEPEEEAAKKQEDTKADDESKDFQDLLSHFI